MSDSVARLKKPQMRGLLHAQIRTNVIVSIALCIGAGVAQHFLFNNARKNVYAEFYKTYDIEKEFNEMRNKGIFDSCKAD